MSSTRERAGRQTGRVLWGRVAVAGVALLACFLAGRASVERGVSRATFDSAQQRITQLEQENRDLAERQVATAAGGIDTPPLPTEPTAADPAASEPATSQPPPDAAASAPSEAAPSDAAPAAGSYTVQENDTLQIIAERVYGDGALFPLIAAANEVDSTNLRIGDTLVIPPPPTEG